MKTTKVHRMTLTAALFLSVWASLLKAGSLEPSAPPTAGTMKPLSDVEPRVAIHQADIPKTITASGSYYLAENVTYSGTGNCISVNVDNVTIDLSGFTMSSSVVGTGTGISMTGRRNVEVRNGTVRNFNAGIFQGSSDGKNHRVFGVRVLACKTQGIYFYNSDNCQVKDCTVADGCTVTGATGNVYAILVGVNSIVSGNTVQNNGGASSCSVYGISAGNNCKITGNTVSDNGIASTGQAVVGIWAGLACTVTDNSIVNNGDNAPNAMYVRAINAATGSVIGENSCVGNGTSAGHDVYGILGGLGCVIRCNTSIDNGDSAGGYAYGIYANEGCTVTGNTAYSNGTGATGTAYGIALLGKNVVNNNTACNNDGVDMNTVSTCVYGTNLPQLP
jgi:hypothetical protein